MWYSLTDEESARIPTKTQRSRLRPSWSVKGSRSHATRSLPPRNPVQVLTKTAVSGAVWELICDATVVARYRPTGKEVTLSDLVDRLKTDKVCIYNK
ncbi:jg14559 [Pararge aegeria aegeria]|uniref:Jg14559 protein n=1 Tax=Pararge aegeria aegeria TaxID=348720 RepID=A0A8S4RCN1_9NEOP|nr:jg14559 [Pararge aegeria aegeria]